MKKEMRFEKVEENLKRGIAEGSCVLITGQTSDSFVYNEHLNPIIDVIRQFSAARNMPILNYSLARQIEDLSVPTSKAKHKSQLSIDSGTPATIVLDKVFDSMEKSDQPTTFSINFAESILPDTTTPTLDENRVLQQILQRVSAASFRVQKHLIILISRVGTINSAFAQMPGVITCNVALPEQVEREAAVEIMLKSQKSPLYLASDMTPRRLARISGGLNIDALSRLRRTTSQNNPLTRDTVLSRKKEIIRKQSGGTLTIHDEERDINEDIAGLAQLKLFIKNTQNDGQNIRALLLGPPGTGKTLSATAVAKSMDTIPISLAQVKSMWVGESEKQFRQVIEIIERNAPVTLILDECDQLSMGSRSGSNIAQDSSSVDTSLRGMLLEWLGDIGANNGISIIAMSNNANGVDPAFRDRLTTIPILEPITAADKSRIAMIQLQRMGRQGNEEGIKRAFAESRRIFTGRQIVKMLAKATRCADKGSGIVSYEEMREAIAGMLRNFGDAEKLMSLRAIRFTDEMEYLPWVASRLMGDDSAEAPEYMQSFLSSDQTEIDQERLDACIADLVSRGY